MTTNAHLVIRGGATRHLPFLARDDFAIIYIHTLHISGDVVRGLACDSYNRHFSFTLPVTALDEFEYLPVEDNDEPPLARAA